MKNLKFLFFVFIIIFSFDVLADTSYNMTSLITSPVNYSECGSGSYTGVELNGATNCWNTNTRNQGTLNRIFFNLPAPTGSSFEPDTTYRLTLNMATQDWRNNFGTVVVSPGSSYTNNFVDTFSFVSMKQVNITFTVPYSGSTTYQYLWVNLPAKNSSSLITGVSNWNLSNVTLTKLTTGSSGGSTTPSGPTTTFDDTAIINNANENTQDVINNNNSNTQDIINNANENTNSLNESINDNCKNTTLTLTEDLSSSLNSYLDNIGDLHILSGASVSTYIKVRPNTSYTLKKITGGDVPSNFSYCLYNANKAYYRCGLMPTNQDEEITINVDSYTTFIRFSMKSYLVYQLKGFICNDFVSEKINDVNDSINSLNEDLINNQNQNTQDIINNQNSNTEREINSQLSCEIIDKSKIIQNNAYINASGSVFVPSSGTTAYGVTDYISIDSNSKLSVIETISNAVGQKTCFYNSSKVMISCLSSESLSNDVTIPNNAFYVRFSINNNSNKPQFRLCRNGNQVIQDSITDSNIDTGVGDSFFDNFNNNMHGLSSIITIPLSSIQSLSSSQCTPLHFPIPFTDNKYLDVPCMTEIYQQHVPTLLTLIQTCWYGILAYKVLVNIFGIVKGFKDPDSDKIEVMDL